MIGELITGEGILHQLGYETGIPLNEIDPLVGFFLLFNVLIAIGVSGAANGPPATLGFVLRLALLPIAYQLGLALLRKCLRSRSEVQASFSCFSILHAVFVESISSTIPAHVCAQCLPLTPMNFLVTYIRSTKVEKLPCQEFVTVQPEPVLNVPCCFSRLSATAAVSLTRPSPLWPRPSSSPARASGPPWGSRRTAPSLASPRPTNCSWAGWHSSALW